jgi:hypothetical protein
MKHANILLLILAAAVVLAITPSVKAQRPILGGYKAAKVTDGAVKEAADFGVSAEAEKTEKTMSLVSILKAETQSVAGTNYRLCMKVSSEGGEGQDDVEITVQAVVNRDLKQAFKLISWAISDCGDDDK